MGRYWMKKLSGIQWLRTAKIKQISKQEEK